MGTVDIAVRALRPEELPLAAAVSARALRDDPSTIAMYGDDPSGRVASLHALFQEHFRVLTVPQVGAFYGTLLVGVAAASAPGRCVGAIMGERAAEVLANDGPGPDGPGRPQVFWAHWALRDLPVAHWHLGPVGVEPGYQGVGVGTAMLRALCGDCDRDGKTAWLETDKERNVRFYSAAGFEVAGEASILGVTMWFMRRDPA